MVKNGELITCTHLFSFYNLCQNDSKRKTKVFAYTKRRKKKTVDVGYQPLFEKKKVEKYWQIRRTQPGGGPKSPEGLTIEARTKCRAEKPEEK